MPGRGTPWRGVGKGKQDRIGSGEIQDDSLLSEDIKDGTIKEIDLDSALQAKVNSGGGHVIEDEGTPLTQRPNMNFIGAGVVASDDGETTNVTIAGGSGGHTIQDEATPLTQRTNLNFVGAGVVASDGIEDTTTVTIAGGGSGIFDPFTVDPNAYHFLYDDFFYPSPLFIAGDNAHWEQIGAGFLQVPNSVVGGQLEVASGSGANLIGGLRTCAGGLVAVDISKKFKIVWVISLTQAITDSAQRIGLFKDAQAPTGTFPFSSEPTPHIWFAHDGSGNYLAETNNGVTPVSIDTGVAVNTAQHVFEISFDPAGTPTVTFKIDGVSVATSTANIPVGNLSMGAVIQTNIAQNKVQVFDTALLVNDR